MKWGQEASAKQFSETTKQFRELMAWLEKGKPQDKSVEPSVLPSKQPISRSLQSINEQLQQSQERLQRVRELNDKCFAEGMRLLTVRTNSKQPISQSELIMPVSTLTLMPAEKVSTSKATGFGVDEKSEPASKKTQTLLSGGSTTCMPREEASDNGFLGHLPEKDGGKEDCEPIMKKEIRVQMAEMWGRNDGCHNLCGLGNGFQKGEITTIRPSYEFVRSGR